MKIFAIADLHLDSKKEKPMDIFGQNWKNHEERIFKSWKDKVNKDDIVLLPGDISWAINLEEALDDLNKIEKLPGTKLIIKGNHDYWWASKSKLNKLECKTIKFLSNDYYKIKDIGIYGTRGWMSRDDKEFTEQDQKIYRRELLRLKSSLTSDNQDIDFKIVMIHFPPFNSSGTINEFAKIMIEYNVDICIYGHLHGEGHSAVKEGNINGINFTCVSSDYLNFELKEIVNIEG